MIYIIIGMSVLLFAIGFMVTEKNAKYILSGYNTMSEDDRKQVDIKAYISHFRNFHIFLGISLLVVGIILTYFVSKNAGGIFLGIYPILAYIYFIATGSKFFRGQSKKRNKIGVWILVGTLIFVVGLLEYGFTENRITFDSEHIEFKGSYGEIIPKSDIQTIELVDELPKIAMKTNGFALGTINKGYFRTKSGEKVKLILNSENKPIILLTKTDGKKIYYSAKDRSNKEIMDEIREILPDILIK